MHRLIGKVLLIAAAVIGGTAQAPSTVEVRGVVRNAATGKVVRRASVQIGQLYNNSDTDGRFTIPAVAPGIQLLTVFRQDYLLTGIRKPGQGQVPVYREAGINIVVPSQSPAEIDIYLTPAPQVSGVVIDSEGRPVEGIALTAYRFTYDITGERTLVRASWEDALPPLYLDPRFLSPLTARAAVLTLGSGAGANVDVRSVPGDQ